MDKARKFLRCAPFNLFVASGREQLFVLGMLCTGTKCGRFFWGLDWAASQCTRKFCGTIANARKRTFRCAASDPRAKCHVRGGRGQSGILFTFTFVRKLARQSSQIAAGMRALQIRLGVSMKRSQLLFWSVVAAVALAGCSIASWSQNRTCEKRSVFDPF
jgi:hypothetical protein